MRKIVTIAALTVLPLAAVCTANVAASAALPPAAQACVTTAQTQRSALFSALVAKTITRAQYQAGLAASNNALKLCLVAATTQPTIPPVVVPTIPVITPGVG